MNIKEKYLPIGTVCLLKNGKQRIMIIGYCSIPENKINKIYDYQACAFPQGVLSFDKTILFNHDQIDKIYYMGYSDEESHLFQQNLKNLINKIKEGELNLSDFVD